MDEDTLEVFRLLIAKLDPHAAGCTCGDCCDCTTLRSFEASAVRFNESAAFTASESQRSYQQQNAAQFAALLKQQST